MDAVAARDRWITEPLTWDEICARYPAQHIAVVDMEWDEPTAPQFRKGRVIGRGDTAGDAIAEARPWRDQYRMVGYFFTGTLRLRLYPRVVTTDESREFLHRRP